MVSEEMEVEDRRARLSQRHRTGSGNSRPGGARLWRGSVRDSRGLVAATVLYNQDSRKFVAWKGYSRNCRVGGGQGEGWGESWGRAGSFINGAWL